MSDFIKFHNWVIPKNSIESVHTPETYRGRSNNLYCKIDICLKNNGHRTLHFLLKEAEYTNPVHKSFKLTPQSQLIQYDFIKDIEKLKKWQEIVKIHEGLLKQLEIEDGSN